jgi:hypothetical protein
MKITLSSPGLHHLMIVLAKGEKLSSRDLLKRSNQLCKTRGRRRRMFRFCYPMTSSKHIERGSRQKSLKLQLLEPNVTRSSYFTGSNTLSNSPFHTRSLCIQCAKFSRFLTLTRLRECGIGTFIRTQNKHFRRR